MTDKVYEFWDSRASLGPLAGTQDICLKELEKRTLHYYTYPGMKVLDLGCGIGENAIWLAQQRDVVVTGVDYSSEMIEEAKRLAHRAAEADLQTHGHLLPWAGDVQFMQADVTNADDIANIGIGDYDLVYSVRMLINFPDWVTQDSAIMRICQNLKPGAKYLMLEHSQDGLDEINRLRKAVDLHEIVSPWHNRYLRDKEVRHLAQYIQAVYDVRMTEVEISGAYYLFSRVVNAYFAKQEGREPDYDAPINHLALKLPLNTGLRGQAKLWIWEKPYA